MTTHDHLFPFARLGIDADIAVSRDDDVRARARHAWETLGSLEEEANLIGGRELQLILECARESLRRRWGPFEP